MYTQKAIFNFGGGLTVFAAVCAAVAGFYVSAGFDGLTKAFAEISYRVESRSEASPTVWEKEQFQMSGKRIYKVKRTTAMKDNKQFFPRFEVVEEIYADEEKAVARVNRIGEKPPHLSGERTEYWMVDGFRKKEKVYFISTDAAIFYADLGKFTEKLEAALKRQNLED